MVNTAVLSKTIMVKSRMSVKLQSIVSRLSGLIFFDCCFYPLTYLGAPKIKTTLKDTEVKEGETLVLEVQIYAVPEPKIVW